MFCNYCGKKNADDFIYCSSCGKKRDVPSSENSTIEETQKVVDNDISSLKLIEKTINCYITGNDIVKIHKEIGEIFNQKNALNIVYNIYLSEDLIVFLPVSKEKDGISLWALAFGGGAIAGFAYGALKGLAKKLEEKNSKLVLEQDNPLYNAIIFHKNETTFKVKEIRGQTGDLIDFIFCKETWIQLSGVCTMKNEKYDIEIKFGHEGKAEKSDALKELVGTLKIPRPKVHKEKPYPF